MLLVALMASNCIHPLWKVESFGISKLRSLLVHFPTNTETHTSLSRINTSKALWWEKLYF